MPTKILKAIATVCYIIKRKVDNMSVNIVTKDNFSDLSNEKKIVLLDFYADWCGPCQMIAPIVAEIASEREDLFVGKINVDNEPELVSAFNIVSIPLLVVMKNGQVVNKILGYHSKEEILKELEF